MSKVRIEFDIEIHDRQRVEECFREATGDQPSSDLGEMIRVVLGESMNAPIECGFEILGARVVPVRLG